MVKYTFHNWCITLFSIRLIIINKHNIHYRTIQNTTIEPLNFATAFRAQSP